MILMIDIDEYEKVRTSLFVLFQRRISTCDSALFKSPVLQLGHGFHHF